MLIHLEFQQPNYVEYIHQLADNFKAKLTNNYFKVPPHIGNGYMWAEKLAGGITVMVAEAAFKQEIKLAQHATSDQCFCLQFNEYGTDPFDKSAVKKPALLADLQSAITLTHTLIPSEFVFPADIFVQTVCLYFNREHLANMLDDAAIGELLTRHFPYLVANKVFEPITTDYRVTLNEVKVEKIESPLRLNFIKNRILLLIEQFIINQFQKKEVAPDKIKRDDDEIIRLMKVEALLVKDFSVAHPPIPALARFSAMSPTKLKNDFKKLYGLPIHEYFQKNRMLKAKSLILTGKYSIKEVGIMVGYTNLSHFANAFKKEFDMLPSAVSAKDGVLVYNS